MVQAVRDTEKVLGTISFEMTGLSVTGKRSLFACCNITEGELFSKNNVKSVRPGYGLPPRYFNDIIGKTAKQNIKKGDPISFDLVL